ncbi:MAG: amidohydrolase family protein [Hyphomonadaceae bacterium]
MPYVEGRIVHDADSHLMELPDCLDAYFDPKYRARYHDLAAWRAKCEAGEVFLGGAASESKWDERVRNRQADPTFKEDADANILLRKNYDAMGAYLPADRRRAMDLLGFSSQLVFSSFCLDNFGLNATEEMDLCYAAASAHNRMISDFCAADKRLLAVANVPLEDFDHAAAAVREAIQLGCKAIRVPARCPKHHSPSHLALDPVWAAAQEAGLPIVFHVEGVDTIQPAYFVNGLPRVKDFHGGDQNLNSVSFMPVPYDVMNTLSALIFDNVLDRFPNLKFGVIELGASWAPGWMRLLDDAVGAFSKNEERLRRLSAKPSEIVRRQVRMTPYCHEDTGWIIANAGEEIFIFSSDYPHVEGGRNPVKRFEDSLAGVSAAAKERFYSSNFVDMMGAGLPAELAHAKRVA